MSNHYFILDGAQDADTVLILAHGAGAPMDSPFMTQIAQLVSGTDVCVVRFEFPYMQKRREDGKKRPPDRAPKLLQHFSSITQPFFEAGQRVFIGGKSMGGRMASVLVSDPQPDSPSVAKEIAGVICLGYPFHPPGKPDKTRIDHFPQIPCPVQIIQGTRDALGNTTDVESYDLPAHVSINWLEDGDHDLKPRKKSGFTHEQHLKDAAHMVRRFMLLS